jgi:aminobenzoyl-glutamate utilization protein B
MKQQLMTAVASHAKDVQVMVDQIFSYSELGFQEKETFTYLTNTLSKTVLLLKKAFPMCLLPGWLNGDQVLQVIALGSDIDCIPKASQKPGVAYKDPIVEGAPGHGEGHNSGQAVIIYAAIAMKEMMEKEHMPGTIVIWPGVAEELVGTKAWYIRDGYFKNIDACIFTHVSGDFSCDYGDNGGNGLVSVRFDFTGDADACNAGAPWRAKSALDAVELMDVGWNFKESI